MGRRLLLRAGSWKDAVLTVWGTREKIPLIPPLKPPDSISLPFIWGVRGISRREAVRPFREDEQKGEAARMILLGCS